MRQPCHNYIMLLLYLRGDFPRTHGQGAVGEVEAEALTAKTVALTIHGGAGAGLFVLRLVRASILRHPSLLDLFLSVDDAASGSIVGADFELDGVSGKNTDAELAHFSTGLRQHHIPRLQFYPVHGIRQNFAYDSFRLDKFIWVFGHSLSFQILPGTVTEIF